MNTHELNEAKKFWNKAELIDKVQQIHALGLKLNFAEQKLEDILPRLTTTDRKHLLNNVLNKVMYNWEPMAY